MADVVTGMGVYSTLINICQIKIVMCVAQDPKVHNYSNTVAAKSIRSKIVAIKARANKGAMCVVADMLAGVIIFITFVYL